MIKYEIFTDRGDRSLNEDSIGVVRRNDDYCFILADGLGGHGSGDLASTSVVNTVKDFFQINGSVSKECLSECIQLAQNKLMDAQLRLTKENEMKTTIVLLALNDREAIWAHVGDSRLYRFRKNKEWIRTMDHSVPQMLVSMGEIKEEEIRGHVDRNRLIKVLGVEWDEPKFEISDKTDLQEKDTFLLCSDGFWELLDERVMLKLLRHNPNPTEWMEKMVHIVRKNGENKEMDNFSAIAVTHLSVKKHIF